MGFIGWFFFVIAVLCAIIFITCLLEGESGGDVALVGIISALLFVLVFKVIPWSGDLKSECDSTGTIKGEVEKTHKDKKYIVVEDVCKKQLDYVFIDGSWKLIVK